MRKIFLTLSLVSVALSTVSVSHAQDYAVQKIEEKAGINYSLPSIKGIPVDTNNFFVLHARTGDKIEKPTCTVKTDRPVVIDVKALVPTKNDVHQYENVEYTSEDTGSQWKINVYKKHGDHKMEVGSETRLMISVGCKA